MYGNLGCLLAGRFTIHEILTDGVFLSVGAGVGKRRRVRRRLGHDADGG